MIIAKIIHKLRLVNDQTEVLVETINVVARVVLVETLLVVKRVDNKVVRTLPLVV